MAGYPYANDILYQDFTLPLGATGATFDYYVQLGTYDNTPPAHHFLYVYLKTVDGQELLEIDQLDNTVSLGVWHYKKINIKNLAAWAGQDLRLSLEARTDGSSLSAFHVDDVILTVNCNLNISLTQGVGLELDPSFSFEEGREKIPVQVAKPDALRGK